MSCSWRVGSACRQHAILMLSLKPKILHRSPCAIRKCRVKQPLPYSSQNLLLPRARGAILEGGVTQEEESETSSSEAGSNHREAKRLKKGYFGFRGGTLGNVVLVVTGLLLNEKGEVLLTQRPEGKRRAGQWELPGGKCGLSELPDIALIRELKEELGVEVAPEDVKPLTFAGVGSESYHILNCLYSIGKWEGTPRGAEGQEMEWLDLQGLDKLCQENKLTTFMDKLLSTVKDSVLKHAVSGISDGT